LRWGAPALEIRRSTGTLELKPVGNPITENIKIGTLGELLVQIRLLQYGVQAAPPIKDSGNDLIAIRGEVFRGIQVKTTTVERHQLRNLPAHYHILALVELRGDGDDIFLDDSALYLLPRSAVEAQGIPECLEPFRISRAVVDNLFPPPL
jgi:hypothetical protein